MNVEVVRGRLSCFPEVLYLHRAVTRRDNIMLLSRHLAQSLLLHCFIAYHISCRFLSKYLHSLTFLPIFDLLNFRRPPNKRIKGTAVIAGASFTDLWTVYVCSDHFEDEVVIRPDAWVCTDSTEEGIWIPVELPVTKRACVAYYNSLHGMYFLIPNNTLSFMTDMKVCLRRISVFCSTCPVSLFSFMEQGCRICRRPARLERFICTSSHPYCHLT